MPAAGTMTSLTGNVDFGPRCFEAELVGIEAAHQPGRMAIRAHAIPVLTHLRPVQHVSVIDGFIPINMKPALPTLLHRAAVPGNTERLDSAVGQFDQVLLQRVSAERVADRKLLQGSVR